MTQTEMMIADEHTPRADWNRPQRISFLQKVLSEKGVSEAKVFLGGERFGFAYAGKYVSLVIYNWRATGYELAAAVYANEESCPRGDLICPLIKKHPPKGCTEEEMIAEVGKILTELA